MLERPYLGNTESIENKRYSEFDTRITGFVNAYISEYYPKGYSRSKVIHDPVWGTNLFYPWELQVLDSPLMQRLRNISQLGLTMLTYPSAHHTRFEHTLGVMSVVTKIVNHINQDSAQPTISAEDFYVLRLAALLHDVGHCFCSHLSEAIYGQLRDFVNLKKSFRIFETAKEHEIFAYIIINTTEFKRFIKERVNLWKTFDDGEYEDLFVKIGYMIVGAALPYQREQNGGYEKKYYLTQIINGQYDADKLDYLRRDSYTAGLALTYDIDRFLYKIQIAIKEEQIEGKTPIDLYDIHISIPKTSIAKDLSNALVITNNNSFVSLSEIIRLSDWADAFASHKWNAYVFSKVEILPMVSIASKVVFERHGLRFDEETVFLNIKDFVKIEGIVRYLKDNGKYPV